MSQFERVIVSLELEGENVKLNYSIAKSRPKLPMRPNSNIGTDAREFRITTDANGKVSIK